MTIYVAPPRGIKEKESIRLWLSHYNHEIIWLDLRRKVKGPLLLCGGADIGKDEERDAREFVWIKQALDSNNRILGICRGMQILNHYFGGKVEDLSDAIIAENFKATHLSYPLYSVVEGFEDLDKKIWAVQWHPEKMESEDNEYPLGKLYHKFL